MDWPLADYGWGAAVVGIIGGLAMDWPLADYGWGAAAVGIIGLIGMWLTKRAREDERRRQEDARHEADIRAAGVEVCDATAGDDPGAFVGATSGWHRRVRK